VPRLSGLKAIVSIFVLAALAVSALPGTTVAKTESGQGVPVNSGEEVRGTAEWTVLVYLLADNDLDPTTEEDFQELKDGNSSESVNVLALVDRLNEPAYLYCIEDNEMVVLESLGEINMGDPATLRWFVDYCDKNFSANHVALFFWDHGTPTAGVGVDTTLTEESEPGTDWDWLSHHEMISALEGYHMDVIATDECSIGQMETVYEYSARGLSVDYLVASESYIGWRGFSYDKIVQSLILDPYMTARDLSLVIVDEFTNLFSKTPYMSEILTTQSVFDMSEIPDLGAAVSAMANAMAADIDDYRDVVYAAQMASLMPWGARCEGWIDMPTFVEQVMEGLKPNDPVRGLCEDVMTAYGNAMIGMGTTMNSEMYGYQGMGILFPASAYSYTTSYADTEWGGYVIYETFVFPNMGWWSFLEAYWGLA